jgi:hypothetical protein
MFTEKSRGAKKKECRLTLNTEARPNLELPLRGQDFGVNSRDFNASKKTSLVVGFDNVTAVDPSGTDTTVVRTLGSGETALWPSVRVFIEVKQGVLLLKPEPGKYGLVCLHDPVTLITVVELVRCAVGIPTL